MEKLNIDRSKLIKYLKDLVSIPSYEDCDEIQKYIMNSLSFIKWEKQYVGKNQLYNIVNIHSSKPFMVNTHVDTVPPIDMQNPFEVREEDGVFYGRGTADTKGLIASLIVALQMFYEKNPDKEIPVSLAFTVDEEQNTALGSEKLKELLGPIKYALILEPTYGRICNKQMGAIEFRLDINVQSAHGAEFEKYDNPSKIGCESIYKLENHLDRLVNIIKFSSGWEFYAVPKSAEILAEIKVFEGEDAAILEEKLINYLKEYKNIRYKREDIEDFHFFGEGFAVKVLKEAYMKAIGKEAQMGVMPSWTDAANIHKAGVECVVFGTSHLDVAHTSREHITIQQMEDMTKILYTLFSILSHLT